VRIIKKISLIFGAANGDMSVIKSGKLNLPTGFSITAHAGALDYPPNTETALRKAIESGADIVEMDVTFRQDLTPVIIHSEKPSKRQGVLFEKVLGIIAEHESVWVNLDLKSFVNLPVIEELVRKHNLLNRVFFTGVDEKMVSAVKSECPGIPLYLNASIDAENSKKRAFAENITEKLIALGCVGLNCNYKNISRELVEHLHENGLLVSVWTVDIEMDMVKMLSISVDNITTRKPDRLKSIITEWSDN